jgi:hypothetical protein
MCSSDAACADAGANGRCMNDQGGPAGCFCTADTCADDSACPSGQTCACHGSPYSVQGNHCVPGDCRVDSDCGAGGWCSPSYDPSGCGNLGGYYCHTPKDACTNDSDCSGGVQGPELCGYDTAAGYWRCMQELLCG